MGEIVDLTWERQRRQIDDVVHPVTSRVVQYAMMQDMIMEQRSQGSGGYSEAANAMDVIAGYYELTPRQLEYLSRLCENGICDTCATTNYG